MFSSPVFLLGTAIASVLAAAYHLWRGTNLKQAILYWFSAVLGFFAGQLLGSVLFSSWPMLGQISIIPALVFSVAALFVVSGLKLC